MFNLLKTTPEAQTIREFVSHKSTAVGLGIPREVLQSHSDTPHMVRLLWTKIGRSQKTLCDQTQTLTRDRLLCHSRDSNPQSQQASERRPTS